MINYFSLSTRLERNDSRKWLFLFLWKYCIYFLSLVYRICCAQLNGMVFKMDLISFFSQQWLVCSTQRKFYVCCCFHPCGRMILQRNHSSLKVMQFLREKMLISIITLFSSVILKLPWNFALVRTDANSC